MAIEDDKYNNSGEFEERLEEMYVIGQKDSHKYEDSKAIAEAIADIAGVVNHSTPKTVGAMLATHLHSQHRTLQAQVIASIIEMFRLYRGSNYDLRNKAAVEAAGLISDLAKEKIAIPLI